MSTETATKTTLHPIFALCCDDVKGTKYDLRTPWVYGRGVYATNGRILVRMPLSEGLDTTGFNTEDRPKLNEHTADYFAAKYQAKGVPCPSLKGKGTDCPRCEGTGTAQGVFCDDCGAFTARGGVWSKCVDCCGCGKYLADDGLTIGPGVVLSFRYLYILEQFKATLFPAVKDPVKSAVKFTVPKTEIEGVVMPLDKSQLRTKS